MTTITCIEQFKNEIRPFIELQIPRSSRWFYYSPYKHHVFVGSTDDDGCYIYHYTSTTNNLCVIPIPKAKIIKEKLKYETYKASSLFDFDKGDVVIIANRTDYPQSDEEKKECLKRAEERLWEEKYSISFNNCESYVNWIFSRDNTSSQVTESTRNQYLALVMDALKNVGPSVLGTIVYGISRDALDNQKTNCDELSLKQKLNLLKTCLLGLEKRIHRVGDKHRKILYYLNFVLRYLQK